MNYYVYELIDTRVNEPFYVGKGKNNRAVSHISRAKKWKLYGFPSIQSVNKKLYHKILSILEDGYEVEVKYVEKHLEEKFALSLEQQLIAEIGLKNLCNLTLGGEGESRTKETIQKIVTKRNVWLQSPAGLAWKEKMSRERTGPGNPSWGHKESPEKTRSRMKNCLAKPRWNTGLKNDPRCKGPPKGAIPYNAFRCRATNLTSGETFEGYVKEVVSWTTIPHCTFMKMLNPDYKSRRWSSFFKIEKIEK